MWRTAFGFLLVAHGLLTVVIWLPRPDADAPMDTSHSWLLGEARVVSVACAVVAGVLIATSGVGLLGDQTWWSIVGLGGGLLSLVLFGLFFSVWWLLAIAISSSLVIVAIRGVA